MGKKTYAKYHAQSSQSQQCQIDNNISNNDMGIDLSNSNKMMEILTGNDQYQKEILMSNIGQNTLDGNDENLRSVLLNIPFIQLLTNELLSTSFQLKHNAIASIINLITSYEDNDADTIILFNTSLITNINVLIKDLANINQSIDINRKTYLLLYDLLALIIDSLQDKEQTLVNKIDLRSIAGNLMDFIMKIGNETNDDELYKQSLIVLYQIVSLVPITINESSMIVKDFIEYLLKINDNGNGNGEKSSLIQALVECLLFYLLCANSTQGVIGENVLCLVFPGLIQKIFKGLDYDLKSQMENFNSEVVIYTNTDIHLSNQHKKIEEDCYKMNDEVNDEKMKTLKKLINQLDMIIHTIYCYIKTFNDIIENTEIASNDPHTIMNIEDYKDNDFEQEEDIEMEQDEDNIIQANHYASIISLSINKYLLNSSSFSSMLSNNLISTLFKLQCNYSIEIFYLNDFNTMLHIKSYLNEIEYISFTLINNILLQFPSLFPFSLPNQSSLLTIISNRLLIDEVTSDEDNTSIIILCLRSLLSSSFFSFNTSFDLFTIDYRLLFRLLNKHINSIFIKCNIVDIVAYIFSNESISLKHLEANLEICQLLNSLFYNEANIEVLSHVINALMDIYQGDNAKINKNLKRVNCVQLMKNGSEVFKVRMKTMKNSGEITGDVYAYVKETYANMKRFIKYKENSFLLLKI